MYSKLIENIDELKEENEFLDKYSKQLCISINLLVYSKKYILQDKHSYRLDYLYKIVFDNYSDIKDITENDINDKIKELEHEHDFIEEKIEKNLKYIKILEGNKKEIKEIDKYFSNIKTSKIANLISKKQKENTIVLNNKIGG